MTNPGCEKSTIRNIRDAKIPHCDNAQHDKSLMRLIDDALASRPEMSQMRKLHEKTFLERCRTRGRLLVVGL